LASSCRSLTHEAKIPKQGSDDKVVIVK